MRNVHCPKNAPEGRDSVEDSIVRQLQRSMERNARMVNRLRRLEQCLSGTDDTVDRRVKTELDEAVRRILIANKALESILKDEEPTW
jgi:predicted ATP-dependent protease